MKSFIIALILTASGLAGSQTIYEYPELIVSPLASETLSRVYLEQRSDRWSQHIWSQVPAILNIVNGLRVGNEEAPPGDINGDLKNAGLAALLIGSGWLTITAGTSVLYQPYRKGRKQVRKLSSKTKRRRLIKERRAEEILADASQMGQRLKYGGMFLNLLGSVAILSQTNNDQTKVQAGIGAIASFLPLVFEYSWISTYRRHNLYKKRIYGPITKISPSYTPESGFGSQLSINWDF